MGWRKSGPLIYMILCLGVAAALLHTRSSGYDAAPKPPLNQVLSEVQGWTLKGDIPLDQEIIKALELDDYVYRTYSKDNLYVSLYIGLYRTAKKVGAAHSPLVCFPGQGWEISKPDAMQLETDTGAIHLAAMTATKGMHRDLLFYWFQARGKTSSGTLLQKVYIFIEGFNRGPTENAFIRVSIPIIENDLQNRRLAALDFIRSFYPYFFAHMTVDNRSREFGNPTRKN